MRVALITNPSSGRGRGATWQQRLHAALVDHGLDVFDLTADSHASAQQAARDAVADGVDALFVAGGDGMVHLGVNACAGSEVPLGIVPNGTGNDNAAALGIPTEPMAAAQAAATALREGAVRPIDCLRVRTADGGERFALGVLSVGFDAVVSQRAEHLRWPHGPKRYTVAAALELPRFRPRRYTIRVDGGDPRTLRAMLVAVANIRQFGGGMQIVPHADPADGRLDLMLLRPVPIPEFVQVFPRVFKGTHVSHPKVEFISARRVQIEVEPALTAYADGEPLGPSPVTCDIVPHGLRLLAP